MAAYEIQLIEGNQRLVTCMDGTNYQLSLVWRESQHPAWHLDIADQAGQMIVSGLRLNPGINLLAHCQHLILGQLIVTSATGEPVQYAGLGTVTKLYWVDS